jgi:hypothetical protein
MIPTTRSIASHPIIDIEDIQRRKSDVHWHTNLRFSTECGVPPDCGVIDMYMLGKFGWTADMPERFVNCVGSSRVWRFDVGADWYHNAKPN